MQGKETLSNLGNLYTAGVILSHDTAGKALASLVVLHNLRRTCWSSSLPSPHTPPTACTWEAGLGSTNAVLDALNCGLKSLQQLLTCMSPPADGPPALLLGGMTSALRALLFLRRCLPPEAGGRGKPLSPCCANSALLVGALAAALDKGAELVAAGSRLAYTTGSGLIGVYNSWRLHDSTLPSCRC